MSKSLALQPILKALYVVLFAIGSSALFAQPGGGGGGVGGGGPPPTSAPIDGGAVVLLAAIAYYGHKKMRKSDIEKW